MHPQNMGNGVYPIAQPISTSISSSITSNKDKSTRTDEWTGYLSIPV
jgi:hypothetical protein